MMNYWNSLKSSSHNFQDIKRVIIVVDVLFTAEYGEVIGILMM